MPGAYGPIRRDVSRQAVELRKRRGAVARAARRLGVTPSAVSHALGRLRVMLKDPVVVRSGRSLRLTPRALALAPVAASVCEAARGLLADAADTDPKGWQDTIRILGSDYALAASVFPALAEARTDAPGLRIAAISLDAPEGSVALHAPPSRAAVSWACRQPSSSYSVALI